MWLVSVVYDLHSKATKREFWGCTSSIASRFTSSWLLMGDFNAILRNYEWLVGRARDNMADVVLNALDDIGMKELLASGAELS